MAQREGADAALGVEAYAYDPGLRVDEQVGLERLRCVEDREIAALLYQLHGQVERRERAERKPSAVRTPPPDESARLRQVARDSLAGKLGADARELAEYFLRDANGTPRNDEHSMLAFGRGYAKLSRALRQGSMQTGTANETPNP